MTIKAADIMTRTVVTAKPDNTVRVIAQQLAEHGISAVPVCDEAGQVLGMVSDGDLLSPFTQEKMLKRAWWLELLAEGQDLAPEFEAYLKLDGRRARDLMTTPVVTATEDASLTELADLLTGKKVKRLPILRDGALVGIVSRADLVRALAHGEMS
jgi:CBS domain-containing protein